MRIAPDFLRKACCRVLGGDCASEVRDALAMDVKCQTEAWRIPSCSLPPADQSKTAPCCLVSTPHASDLHSLGTSMRMIPRAGSEASSPHKVQAMKSSCTAEIAKAALGCHQSVMVWKLRCTHCPKLLQSSSGDKSKFPSIYVQFMACSKNSSRLEANIFCNSCGCPSDDMSTPPGRGCVPQEIAKANKGNNTALI